MTDESRRLAPPVPWEGEGTVLRLRDLACATWPAGTRYEVLSSIPGDFGRERVVAWVETARAETPLQPYVPGQFQVDVPRACVVRCRELVPGEGARGG